MQGGRTPLDHAKTEEVQAALREHGGKHSLFHAAEKGMREEVAEVIKGGSDVNVEDRHGSTPLHWAAAWRQLEAAKALLEAHAAVDVNHLSIRQPEVRHECEQSILVR